MSVKAEASAITENEAAQIERANVSGAAPVVFIHGLWLLPTSWEPWAKHFEADGFVALTPGWPDDPETVEEAKANPDAVAGKSIGQVADHFETVIRQLDRRPAIVGHSFGGLLTEILAGRGLAFASVAIAPAPFRGVLPLPLSALRSGSPVLSKPGNYNKAVPLTYDQFRYAFANAVDEDEAKRLYDSCAVPAPGKPLFQAASREPEPVDGGQGRHEEPGPRPAPARVRRAGPHRPEGDRRGVFQEGAEERERDRARGDEGPRSRADDRQRLAGGRRHRPRLREEVRLVAECTHLDQILITELPENIAGCEECLKTGDRWLHLRMCETCGKIGCCDSSPNRHASRHAREDGHPVARSAEPGEDWSWCFVDEVAFVVG